MDTREKMIDAAYEGIDNVHDLGVTLDDYAEAAANAHHRAQVMKAFGVEVK